MTKRYLDPASQADQGPSKKRQIEPVLDSIGSETNFTGMARWSSAAISSHKLPPLPPILDPELEREAFTHPGADAKSNYEKLEWFGDACIEIIATDLILVTFPHTPASRCNQLREQLVRNITLARFYRQYGFETRTKLPPDMEPMAVLMKTNPNDRQLIKIQGDIFESYVGAIVRSDPVNGRQTATQWLKALWGREIRDQIVAAEAQGAARKQTNNSADPTGTEVVKEKEYLPKEMLSKMIVVKGIRLRYEDEPKSGLKKDKHLNLPLFIIGVYLDGWGEENKLLGVGSALKKTEAGQKAATMAMQNKKLMKLYGDKKAAFLEAQKAAEAASAGQSV